MSQEQYLSSDPDQQLAHVIDAYVYVIQTLSVAGDLFWYTRADQFGHWTSEWDDATRFRTYEEAEAVVDHTSVFVDEELHVTVPLKHIPRLTIFKWNLAPENVSRETSPVTLPVDETLASHPACRCTKMP